MCKQSTSPVGTIEGHQNLTLSTDHRSPRPCSSSTIPRLNRLTTSWSALSLRFLSPFALHFPLLTRPQVDTNFINFSVQNKLELLTTMMNCLYATCNPIITDCVMAELETLGRSYRIALQIARDERWERMKCDHSGNYADDWKVSDPISCRLLTG